MKRKLLTGAVLLLVLVSFTSTDKKLTERERALHALNRLAFGPRPGDVDRVVKDGVDVWIAQQLHPEAIPDREVEARLDFPVGDRFRMKLLGDPDVDAVLDDAVDVARPRP